MPRFSVIVAPSMSQRPLSSTVVGSYPQPEWLIDRDALGSHSVPRVRMTDAWRIPEPHLREAQDDATVVAIRDMERAGIDTITDGEIRRESYSNRFATALDGVDADNPATIHTAGGEAPSRAAHRRARSGWRGARRGRATSSSCAPTPTARTKITLPGPFTMAQQASNEAYDDPDELVMDFAAAVNQEALALAARRRGRDPARRAVAAERSRRRAADRGGGDRPRARRAVGHDRRAPVLRLRGARRRQEPKPLRLPRRAERQHRPADLDRGGAAAPRPRPAVRAQPQGHRARRARPRRRYASRPPSRSPTESAPRSRTCPPSESCPPPTAG